MLKLGFFWGIILLFFSACKKNSNNPIPSLSFEIVIHMELPSYNALQGVGGWCYVNGGVQGIIVYRKSFDEFVAFDRKSPASTSNCINPLTPDKNNFLQLLDSCTSAKFSMYDGSIISGSDYGLRQYQTTWNGSNLLRIYN
jgi:hypothetical protein